jgi:general transcription factor 3C polypeptide 2
MFYYFYNNIYYISLYDLFHKYVNIFFFSYESVADMPYMSYGLAHDFGAVWDMAWCPSGAYEPNNKIGLLALSTSCGDCPIFAMPCTDENSEMYC